LSETAHPFAAVTVAVVVAATVAAIVAAAVAADCHQPAHILSAIDPATGKPLDDKRVMSEIATFMGAGFETTSHAITWALALLVGCLQCLENP
jgi:cytochrome P450